MLGRRCRRISWYIAFLISEKSSLFFILCVMFFKKPKFKSTMACARGHRYTLSLVEYSHFSMHVIIYTCSPCTDKTFPCIN